MSDLATVISIITFSPIIVVSAIVVYAITQWRARQDRKRPDKDQS